MYSSVLSYVTPFSMCDTVVGLAFMWPECSPTAASYLCSLQIWNTPAHVS